MQHDEEFLTRLEQACAQLDADVAQRMRLSLQYLAAREEDGDWHLEPGSAEERDARAALAELLRDHLALVRPHIALWTICVVLADLIDPMRQEN